MIRGLFVDQLKAGRRPVYETYPDARYYVFRGGHWVQQRDGALQNQVYVPMGIDTTLETFEQDLRRWIADAQELPENGTLLFTILPQSENPEQDHFGYVLLAGMVYFPTFNEMAIHLQDEPLDVADFILTFSRSGYHHPAFQNLLQARRVDELKEAAIRQVEEAASRRARRLLDECLTPTQRTELADRGYFHVRAKTGEMFRIYDQRHQNIFRVEDKREVMRYCVVIRDTSIPVYDGMLAQKLLIEYNFEEFIRLSNKWDLTREIVKAPDLEDLISRLFTPEDIVDAGQYVIEPVNPAEVIEDIPPLETMREAG